MNYTIPTICKAQAAIYKVGADNNRLYIYGENIQALSSTERAICQTLNSFLFKLFDKKTIQIVLNNTSHIVTHGNPTSKTFIYKEDEKYFKIKVNSISIATPRTNINNRIIENVSRFHDIEAPDFHAPNKFLNNKIMIPLINKIRLQLSNLYCGANDEPTISQYTAPEIYGAALIDAFAPNEMHKTQQNNTLYRISTSKDEAMNRPYYIFLNIEHCVRTWEKI